MERLTGVLKSYAWGSRTAIAALRGVEPSGEPEAELWLGAHPQGSATLPDRHDLPLIDHIAADPVAQLGDEVMARFGPRLPFLTKLLAAAEPLSIQAHPSVEQARIGYDAEEAAGVAVDDPARSFRDPNHKPELIVALARFEALVGLRPAEQTADFFSTLGADALFPLIGALESGGARAALGHIMSLAADDAARAVGSAVAAAHDVEGQWRPEADLLGRLDAVHPGDRGVLTAALLNRVTLEPGEGLMLGPGVLHSYVRGLGLETMSNSDNVIRGGLTRKHIDVDTLLQIVDPSETGVEILTAAGDVAGYPTSVPDFALTVVSDGAHHRSEPPGPRIATCTSGTARLVSGDCEIVLGAGESAWIPAADASVEIEPDGVTFVVGVGPIS